MTLPSHNINFKRRLAWFEKSFLTHYRDTRIGRYERWYRLEGLISQTWQSWGQFCRSVLIDSCLGTEAQNGRVISRAQASWIDEQCVVYEACCVSRNQKPKPGSRFVNARHEITWGDTDKLLNVILKLGPDNQKELLSGFGTNLTGPGHMQIVRNAAAHINHENVAGVKKLTAYYFGMSLKYPTDIATWSVITTKDPAFISWTDDMRTIADLCVL